MLLLSAESHIHGSADVLLLLVGFQVVGSMSHYQKESNDDRDCAKCRREDETEVVKSEVLP